MAVKGKRGSSDNAYVSSLGNVVVAVPFTVMVAVISCA